MDPVIVTGSSSVVEGELARLRRLQQDGKHEDVLDQVAGLVGDYPENRDLLLLVATSQRHLMRIPEALATLERLEAVQPRFSRMHQERGLCHVALRDAPQAIEALLRAVNINPALPMSWRMLDGLYRMTGEAENAAMAASHVAILKDLPAEVLTATSLFSDGELAHAEAGRRG